MSAQDTTYFEASAANLTRLQAFAYLNKRKDTIRVSSDTGTLTFTQDATRVVIAGKTIKAWKGVMHVRWEFLSGLPAWAKTFAADDIIKIGVRGNAIIFEHGNARYSVIGTEPLGAEPLADTFVPEMTLTVVLDDVSALARRAASLNSSKARTTTPQMVHISMKRDAHDSDKISVAHVDSLSQGRDGMARFTLLCKLDKRDAADDLDVCIAVDKMRKALAMCKFVSETVRISTNKTHGYVSISSADESGNRAETIIETRHWALGEKQIGSVLYSPRVCEAECVGGKELRKALKPLVASVKGKDAREEICTLTFARDGLVIMTGGENPLRIDMHCTSKWSSERRSINISVDSLNRLAKSVDSVCTLGIDARGMILYADHDGSTLAITGCRDQYDFAIPADVKREAATKSVAKRNQAEQEAKPRKAEKGKPVSKQASVKPVDVKPEAVEPSADTQVFPEVPPKPTDTARVVKVSESVIPAMVIFRELPGMADVKRRDVRKIRDSHGRKVAYVVRAGKAVRILWREWYRHDDASLDATVRAMAESWAKAA